MTERIIVNADDLGLSPGVNLAVFEAAANGGLTHASLLANAVYYEAAAQKIRQGTTLSIGLHVNLTMGQALSHPSRIPLLAHRDGSFRLDFFRLLGLSLSRYEKALEAQAGIEVAAQIEKCLKSEIPLTHIDGHQHVHIIPPISRAVHSMAERYRIPRIREINEHLTTTLSCFGRRPRVDALGFLKYLFVRRISSYIPRTNKIYFFSIYYSCRMDPALLRRVRVPPGYDGLEIMLHPGFPLVDARAGIKDRHLLSSFRLSEYHAALQLKDAFRPGEDSPA